MKFQDLAVGDYFTFPNSTSFFNVCKKVSARCYTWRGMAYVKRGGKLVIKDNATLKTRIGTVKVEVKKNDGANY